MGIVTWHVKGKVADSRLELKLSDLVRLSVDPNDSNASRTLFLCSLQACVAVLTIYRKANKNLVKAMRKSSRYL